MEIVIGGHNPAVLERYSVAKAPSQVITVISKPHPLSRKLRSEGTR